MRYCEECGTRLPELTKCCPNCQKRIDDAESTKPEAKETQPPIDQSDCVKVDQHPEKQMESGKQGAGVAAMLEMFSALQKKSVVYGLIASIAFMAVMFTNVRYALTPEIDASLILLDSIVADSYDGRIVIVKGKAKQAFVFNNPTDYAHYGVAFITDGKQISCQFSRENGPEWAQIERLSKENHLVSIQGKLEKFRGPVISSEAKYAEYYLKNSRLVKIEKE